LSARLAELHAIRGLLQRTVEVVGAGWVQGGWFTVASAGGERTIMASDLHLVVVRPVTGACLVGAVVQAAGGPATVRSQLFQRTLDLTWHALREDPSRPVHWCPSPRLPATGSLGPGRDWRKRSCSVRLTLGLKPCAMP
jgi:hypothetical protein